MSFLTTYQNINQARTVLIVGMGIDYQTGSFIEASNVDLTQYENPLLKASEAWPRCSTTAHTAYTGAPGR